MLVNTREIPEHFYLYCALLFNNNESVRYSKNTEILKTKVDKILELNKVERIPMPDHRYQYLLSVLNSNNYKPTEGRREPHDEILKYIEYISELPEMKTLWEKNRTELVDGLKSYAKPIKDVVKLFKTHFDFEPIVNNFYVTRNWDRSGMSIPTKKAFYIIVGWNSTEPNVRNIIHEIMHAYANEVELRISNNIETIINGLSNEIFSNYKKTRTIVYESLVRALVVYLSKKCPDVGSQDLSEEDLELQLPAKYLQRLECDAPEIISKEYLSSIQIS
jgi:hypothetical protein